MLPNWWSGHTQDHYLPGSEPPFSLPFNDICKNTNKILQDQTLPLYIKANGCPGAICIYNNNTEVHDFFRRHPKTHQLSSVQTAQTQG